MLWSKQFSSFNLFKLLSSATSDLLQRSTSSLWKRPHLLIYKKNVAAPSNSQQLDIQLAHSIVDFLRLIHFARFYWTNFGRVNNWRCERIKSLIITSSWKWRSLVWRIVGWTALYAAYICHKVDDVRDRRNKRPFTIEWIMNWALGAGTCCHAQQWHP